MKKNLRWVLLIMLFLATLLLFNGQAISSDLNTREAYNQYLINSLDDENIGIRTSAATLLGERRVVEAVEPLIKMLKNEKNYSARIVAAIALYRIGDERAIPVLEHKAKKDKNKTVRHVLNGIIQEMDTTKVAKL